MAVFIGRSYGASLPRPALTEPRVCGVRRTGESSVSVGRDDHGFVNPGIVGRKEEESSGPQSVFEVCWQKGRKTPKFKTK